MTSDPLRRNEDQKRQKQIAASCGSDEKQVGGGMEWGLGAAEREGRKGQGKR